MANDPEDLVPQLCTQAAMIMEDVLDSALMIKGARTPARSQQLEVLRDAAARISKLIDAAIALDA
jgi:hypothetical protein